MNSNNSSIINNRTTNNQQLAPGAPSNQVYNQQQNISQYGNNNNYSNQNNLNNNFNMVAAGQQSGMDGYNSQVRNFHFRFRDFPLIVEFFRPADEQHGNALAEFLEQSNEPNGGFVQWKWGQYGRNVKHELR